jgi:GT2 family glycosyltransferase
LVSFLDQNPDYGAVQPKIMFEGERHKIWNAGGGYFKLLEMSWSVGIGQEDQGQFDQEKDTPWITGCAMLIRSAVIRKAGMLDDRFFAYYEDVEWSLRIQEKGYKLGYFPKSKIYHVAGGSSKKIKTKEGVVPPILHYYRTRNHLFLIRSHSNPASFVLSLLYQTAKNGAFILYLGLNGRFQKVNAILKGLVGHDTELVTITDADVLFLHNWQSETIKVFRNIPKAGVVGIVHQFCNFKGKSENVLLANFFTKKIY